MILREKITFILKEIVYIRVDYINLLKGRFFIMTTTHPTVFNIIINSTIPKILIFVNPTDKLLKIYKDIYLNIIYKFIKTIYFLIDIFKMATALTITTIILFEPLL